MNWWQTLIVAVVPVMLTLVITNISESRRRGADARERERDRNSAQHAAEDARREAIADHWRNERLARTTALIDGVAEIARRVNEADSLFATIARLDNESAAQTVKDQIDELMATAMSLSQADLEARLSAASTIASEEFYVGAVDITRGVRNYTTNLYMDHLRLKHDESSFVEIEERLDWASTALRTHSAALVDLARRELTDNTVIVPNSPLLL